MTNTAKDALRKATVGSKNGLKRETVDIDGNIFEVRQPSLMDKELVYAELKKNTDVPEGVAIIVNMVIACTFVPGTDEKVFDSTDFDNLSSRGSGSFVDIIWGAYQNVDNLTVEDAKKT
tara:strand:- start:2009 stop:2365 length:357 start_codon:yes stop_codon:yes gene_type:complete